MKAKVSEETLAGRNQPFEAVNLFVGRPFQAVVATKNSQL